MLVADLSMGRVNNSWSRVHLGWGRIWIVAIGGGRVGLAQQLRFNWEQLYIPKTMLTNGMMVIFRLRIFVRAILSVA